MAAVARPVVVLAGKESPPFFRPAAEWLAARLGTEVISLGGGNTPQRDRPQEVAEAIRRYVKAN